MTIFGPLARTTFPVHDEEEELREAEDQQKYPFGWRTFQPLAGSTRPLAMRILGPRAQAETQHASYLALQQPIVMTIFGPLARTTFAVREEEKEEIQEADAQQRHPVGRRSFQPETGSARPGIHECCGSAALRRVKGYSRLLPRMNSPESPPEAPPQAAPRPRLERG